MILHLFRGVRGLILLCRTRHERSALHDLLLGPRTKEAWVRVVDLLIDVSREKGVTAFLLLLEIVKDSQFYLWPQDVRVVTSRLREMPNYFVQDKIFAIVSVDDEFKTLDRWRKNKMSPLEEAHWELD